MRSETASVTASLLLPAVAISVDAQKQEATDEVGVKLIELTLMCDINRYKTRT